MQYTKNLAIYVGLNSLLIPFFSAAGFWKVSDNKDEHESESISLLSFTIVSLFMSCDKAIMLNDINQAQKDKYGRILPYGQEQEKSGLNSQIENKMVVLKAEERENI